MDRSQAAIMFLLLTIFGIVGLILIGVSVKILPILYVGLNVSYNSYQVDLSKLWTSGRYFVGLGNDFLTFPTVNQIIIFSSTLTPLSGTIAGIDYTEGATFFPSIVARTKEGLPVNIDLCLFYKLGNNRTVSIQEQLYDIFLKFGTNWVGIVKELANFEMLNVAATYAAYDFFAKRAELGADFEFAIQSTLREYYFDVAAVSITNLTFPAAYDTAITATSIAYQTIELNNFQKDAVQINADTNVDIAYKDYNITYRKLVGAANVSYIGMTGVANSTQYYFQKRTEAFQEVQNQLQFSDQLTYSAARKLLDYFWIFTQKYNSFQKSTLNIPKPEALNQQ